MNWLIPLKNKGPSGAYNVNFLLQDKNIYFSDNHRTALWCWMQHLKPSENVAVFHIDRHYDTLHLSQLPNYTVGFPGVFKLGNINDYLNLNLPNVRTPSPLIRWDNYLTYFICESSLKNHINCVYLATHRDGSYPENPHNHSFVEVESYNLLEELDSSLEHHEKLIVNVDLDYFFTDESEEYFQLIDDEFITKFFKKIKSGISDSKIICLTICLSPECCGGWKNAERILEIAKKELETNFSL